MHKQNRLRKLTVFLAVFCLVFLSVLYMNTPSHITTFEGENLSQRPIWGSYVSFPSMSQAVAKTAEYTPAQYQTTANLFGIVPLKTVNVDVVPKTMLVPCGNPIGVKLYTEGLLVISLDSFETTDGKTVSPASDAGLKVGDIILEYNKEPVENIDDFVEKVDQLGSGIFKISIIRGEKQHEVKIKPQQANADGKFKIGAWVRDSTAGIGTLTFYNPTTQKFVALGHGIVDSDVGAVYSISGGEIEPATILSISKGQRGIPGELKGIFSPNRSSLGQVDGNTPSGIYGTIRDPKLLPIHDPMEAASRSMVQEGTASILCAVHGEEVEEYKIEIQKIMANDHQSSKSLIIKITDPRLLEKTGGIVQGMSGSPILQNGKIIGAVTHVFVNDPTRGYGIFIDSMLDLIQ